MKFQKFNLLKLSVALGLMSWSSFSSLAYAECPGKELLERLNCIEGVQAKIGEFPIIYELKVKQPVDHANPNGASFQQRVVLIHKDEKAPMVLQTSGYAIFGVAESELAFRFQANQLQVEHRYFDHSIPENADYAFLTILQSANDFHRITEKLKTIYKGPWVGTGASKGGMTSVYHRRFFPADLDATVAYVAPLSFSREDKRYNDFLDQVGGEKYAACRSSLIDFQRAALKRREEIVDPKEDANYTRLGGALAALEVGVADFPYSFWQYGDPEHPRLGCDRLIQTNSFSVKGMRDFLRAMDAYGSTDADLKKFQSYYFQAAHELGAPNTDLRKISDLIRHPRLFAWNLFMPTPFVPDFRPQAMLDVDQWVQTQAEKVLFVYGEFDPWTAGAFRLGENTKIATVLVPKANHGAKLTSKLLDEGAREASFRLVADWMKVALPPPALLEGDQVEFKGPTLEELEFEAKKALRLKL